MIPPDSGSGGFFLQQNHAYKSANLLTNMSDENPYPVTADGSAVSFPYRVPKDCVFVLNDYRPNLSDSRTYGGIVAQA